MDIKFFIGSDPEIGNKGHLRIRTHTCRMKLLELSEKLPSTAFFTIPLRLPVLEFDCKINNQKAITGL